MSCNKSEKINISDEEDMNQIIDYFEEYNHEDNHSSNYIYDQNKLHRFDIFLTKKNLNEINQIDGFLIGGASQNSNKFIDIIKKSFN